MIIKELIDKYFEGETTCEEEKQIRLYFTQENLPTHIEKYRLFFSYFDEEIEKKTNKKPEVILPIKRKFSYRLVRLGVIVSAACALIIFGGIAMYKNFALPQNYVMIDGVCFTEKDLVVQEAFNSLKAVSISEEDLFNNLLHN